MKTPSFWYRAESEKPGLPEQVLTPLSALYRLGHEIHQRIGVREKSPIPVICAGNINAGGSGKTPSALALMETIKKHGLAKNPFFLTRGYGGDEHGPAIVNPDTYKGDEPLLLARAAPTIVSADRVKGARLAAHRLSDLLVMDDGLQNPHVEKNIKLVVIDGVMGFGNGKLLPAGPLREPLERGLGKADAFIFIGSDERNVKSRLPAKPIFTASLKAEKNLPRQGRYVAFAGLGYPEKFFSFLRENQKITLAETIAYADHHRYSAKDVVDLEKKASDLGAELVTTEKDYARLPKVPALPAHVLRVKLEWDDEPALVQFLKTKLA